MGARRIAAAAGLAASAAAGAALADCPGLADATGDAATDAYRIEYRVAPSPVRAAEPFDLEIAVCGPDGAFVGPLDVDADMPLHRHGMNYRPTVAAAGPGRFRAAGMLFHMPGGWRFKFVLGTAAGPVRLSAPYDLE